MSAPFDLVLAGAGPAGLMAAIAVADRGGRACLIEASDRIGGAMLINRGQLSGAGTRLQADQGIDDDPEKHFEDAMRISRGTSNSEFLAMAVKLQGPLIDWLMDHGFEMEDDMPRIIHGHEAYLLPRTYWGKKDGLSILEVLEPMIARHSADGRIHIRTAMRVDRLLMEGGAATGVVTTSGEEIKAAAVALTTGGYAADPATFSHLHPGATLWSGSYAFARGDGLRMGLEAGGAVGLVETFLPNFGGILDHMVSPPRFRAPGGLTPQDRLPWEIIVNSKGERFAREDEAHVDDRARILTEQPESRAWVIYDQRIRDEAPSIFSYFPPDKARRFYDPDGSIVSAESIDELARSCGIDPARLRSTVDSYNLACVQQDDPLGRKHLPCPIEQAPFYALPIHAYCVRSYAGLKVDTSFRVVDKEGQPVSGLYAVGEVLGSQLSGKGAVGGMALTPALAFGRLLGETVPIAAEARSPA